MTPPAVLRAVEADAQLEPVTLELVPPREDRDWRAIAVAVRGLRGASTVQQLFSMIPAELCRCGFTRAWLSQVDGTNFKPVSFHGVTPRKGGAHPRPTRQVPLDRVEVAGLLHGSHEAEMVRRRRAVLVADAGADGLVDPLIAKLFGPTSYVAAPLVVDTRVVAFLHADRPRAALALDDYDRDVLDVFAEAVSQALQRVVLTERLERLRTDVRALTNSVGDLVEQRCYEPVGLSGSLLAEDRGGIAGGDALDGAGAGASASGSARASASGGYAAPPPAGSRLGQLLTSRELEVLRLMATGETNAGIAKQLVISQGTVKSHVKNVLRKLHAANRAQAVSRYFRLARAEGAA